MKIVTPALASLQVTRDSVNGIEKDEVNFLAVTTEVCTYAFLRVNDIAFSCSIHYNYFLMFHLICACAWILFSYKVHQQNMATFYCLNIASIGFVLVKLNLSVQLFF